MTTFERFERDIPQLMAELAPPHVPDYVDDMLRQTAGTPQRPAWSALERWLPMDVLARPVIQRSPSLRPLFIAAIVAVLIGTTIAIVSIGSPPRLPAPFGLATNGRLFFHRDGVIYAGDPTTQAVEAVVAGPNGFASPLVSRDGRQVVFELTDGDTTTLYVADVDGSDAHPLAMTLTDLREVDWSPDSRQIAVVSVIRGSPVLSVLEADGSSARTLALELDVKSFWYLPDGRFLFMGTESVDGDCHHVTPFNTCSLEVVNADGSGMRQIIDADSFQGIHIANPAPDGRTLVYERWLGADTGRLRVVDLETGEDRPVSIDNLDPREASNRAQLSPDGTMILFDRFEDAGTHWAVVPTNGGVARNLGPAIPEWPDDLWPEAAFSPDGRWVLAFYPSTDGTNELWLLDPTGQAPDQRLSLPVSAMPAWQRTIP